MQATITYCLTEAAQRAEAAKEAEKTAALDAFVAASGDALLIAQHADGMLCRKTILARMANAALDDAGLPPECPDSVVCRDSDCPCGDDVVECIPTAIYAEWKRFAVLPDGHTVEFHWVRNCRGGAGEEERADPVEYHAVVTIPSGPFQFTRRIRLDA